jgi:hypothetical protein
MKVEIEISSGKEHEKEDMPMGKSMELSALQIKVAKMLAKKAGRSKPNSSDLEKVKDLEEEEEDDA